MPITRSSLPSQNQIDFMKYRLGELLTKHVLVIPEARITNWRYPLQNINSTLKKVQIPIINGQSPITTDDLDLANRYMNFVLGATTDFYTNDELRNLDLKALSGLDFEIIIGTVEGIKKNMQRPVANPTRMQSQQRPQQRQRKRKQQQRHHQPTDVVDVVGFFNRTYNPSSQQLDSQRGVKKPRHGGGSSRGRRPR